MKRVMMIVILVALTIAACAPHYVVCPDGTRARSAEECPSVKELQNMVDDMQKRADDALNEGLGVNTGSQDKDQGDTPEIANEDSDSGNEQEEGLAPEVAPEVADLKSKISKIKSYKFSYAVLPENKARRIYYVKGDKVKVELVDRITTPDKKTYDTVYLDRSSKTAEAYCTQNPVICKNSKGKVADVDYDTYNIELPYDIISSVDNAKFLNEMTYEKHSSIVFSYYNDGKYYRIVASKFYGLPLLVEIYDNPDFEGEPTGYSFRDMAFNTVKDDMVNPPE